MLDGTSDATPEVMKYVILVGTDYSEASDLALQQAFELMSVRPNAELHVVNVRIPYVDVGGTEVHSTPSGLQRISSELAAYVNQQLAEFQKHHQSTPTGKLVNHVRVADPGREIAQLAADLEADLVVVGTHDRRGIERLLLSSVAQVVSRLAPCPVLITRPKRIPAAVPAIEPPCPRCVEARFASHGAVMWCEQHSERHGQRHTYHQSDRVGSETNFPLVFGR